MAIGVKDSNIVDILEGEFDGAPQSRVEKILVAKAKGEEYTGPILSRVEYLLNESGGGGTGGTNVPKFTLTMLFDEYETPTIKSFTCDHTYSECLELFMSEDVYNTGRLAQLVEIDEADGSEPYIFPQPVVLLGQFSNETSSWLEYCLMAGVYPSADIKYYEDGHIEYVNPSSHFADDVVITTPGWYSLPTSQVMSGVTVDVPWVIHGTFTPESTDELQTIDLPYTGYGYPIAAIVFIAGGLHTNQKAWANSDEPGSIGTWTMTKAYTAVEPAYSNYRLTDNNMGAVTFYAHSKTEAGEKIYGGDSIARSYYYQQKADQAMTFTANNALSYFASDPDNTRYHFSPNFTYEYYVIYSS